MGSAAAVGATAIATAAAPAARTGVMWVSFIRMIALSLLPVYRSSIDRRILSLTLPELLARKALSSPPTPINAVLLTSIGFAAR
jgi:hypothetical protein